MNRFFALNVRQLSAIWIVGLVTALVFDFAGPRMVRPFLRSSLNEGARYSAMQIQREHELDSAYTAYGVEHPGDTLVQQLLQERRERAAHANSSGFSETQIARLVQSGVVDTSYKNIVANQVGFSKIAVSFVGLLLSFVGRILPWVLGALTLWWASHQHGATATS